jgi:hypothetical protein
VGEAIPVGSLRPIRTARKTLGGRTLERPSCGGFMPTAETTLFPAYSARSRRLLTSSVRLDNLNQKFPRSNYQSTLERAKAVIKEIATVLLPGTRNLDPSEQKIEAEQQMYFAIIEGKEFFDDELNLRERLDAMIDRKVKHLIQLKAMKQMLRQTPTAREDEQPKRTTARNAPK